MKRYFLIEKTDNKGISYYGKKSANLPLNKDNYEIALYIEEIGYKTKQSALKGIETLKKHFEKIKIDYENCNFKIHTIKIIKDN